MSLKADCPDRGTKHTPEPEGYLQWHAWAAEMGKTHRQKRCPTCGLWAIWVPKKRGTPPALQPGHDTSGSR